MKRYNNILRNLNDIITENMELQFELKAYQLAEELKKDEPQNVSPNAKELMWQVQFGKEMLAKTFRKETNWSKKRDLSYDGKSFTLDYEEWFDELFKRESRELVPSNLSEDRVVGLLINNEDIKNYYQECCDEVRMEWVREQKGGNEND